MRFESKSRSPVIATPVAMAVAFFILHPSSFILAAQNGPFFEPKEGYYGAKGTRVAAEWSLDRTQLRVDESLVATLTVRGATNPQEISRPDLRSLPKFSSRFQIEDLPNQPPAPKAEAVSFAYRLRPRTPEVDGIPSMDFFFLNTAIAAQSGRNPYMNMRVKGLAITVTAALPKAKLPTVPLDAPEHLLDIATGPELLQREPLVPGIWGWFAILLLVPVAAGTWFAAWRRVYPGAARLARLRRTRAVRRACDAIRRSGRSADPAAAVAAAILGYLRVRFPLPSGTETPSEVRGSLLAAGLAPIAADDVAAFLHRCDEARFAPSSETGKSLVPEAEDLISRLEAVE